MNMQLVTSRCHPSWQSTDGRKVRFCHYGVYLSLGSFVRVFLNSRRCYETNLYPIYEETLLTHERNRFQVESVIHIDFHIYTLVYA